MKEQMQALDAAMKGLLRLGVPLAVETSPLEQQAQPTMPPASLPTPPEDRWECRFREELMDEILEKRPGLTREELSRQMAEMGF